MVQFDTRSDAAQVHNTQGHTSNSATSHTHSPTTTHTHVCCPSQEHAPCVLFVDEVDAICPKRETAHREMERRIVTQLLASLDGEYIDFAHAVT